MSWAIILTHSIHVYESMSTLHADAVDNWPFLERLEWWVCNGLAMDAPSWIGLLLINVLQNLIQHVIIDHPIDVCAPLHMYAKENWAIFS